MFVETKTEKGWIVLDPMFNLAFRDSSGKIAGFKDLQQNWDNYKSQVPADYKPEYSYRDVRYANWKKVPLLTPAIKSTLNFFIGKEKADHISIRPYLLRNYHKLAWVAGFALLLSLLQTFRVYRRKKKYTSSLNSSLDTSMELENSAA
jgi:hypothetical protein